MASRNSYGTSARSPTQNFVNYPSAVPATTTQTAPANGANIRFAWSIPDRANGFILQIAKDPGFTQIIANNVLGYHVNGVTLSGFADNGQTYYWRVAATNAVGTGPYSSTRTVNNVSSAAPSAPLLNSPTNTSTASGTSVNFSWSSSARANNYVVQVSTNSAFTDLLVNSAGGNITAISFNGFPDNGQSLYWHVAASNSVGQSSYSSLRVFNNGPSAIPTTPTTQLPANGAKVSGTVIAFRWSTLRALTSTLQVATDPGFTNLLYNGIVANSTGTDLSGLPDNGQTLYWRVRGNNSLGSSAYSALANVINGPSAVPAIPTLSTPANGVTVSGYNIRFNWALAARANDYLLEVSTDAGFARLIFNQWVGNRTTMDVTPFYDIGQAMFWRVRARNSLGTGTVSSTRGFTSDRVCSSSAIGTGMGVLTRKSHIDICYENASAAYYLKDVSRRTNNNPHGHNGKMAANASISTAHKRLGLYGRANTQFEGSLDRGSVDAQVYTDFVYDYWLSRFNLNGDDNIGSTMLNITEVLSSEDSNCPQSGFYDLRTGFVNWCFDSANLSHTGALDIVGHEWAHGLTRKVGAGFGCCYEAATLDEAFSDWMGTAIQTAYGQANWTIKEGITNPYIRNMSDPHLSNFGDGTPNPQPDSYRGQYWIETNGCIPTTANDDCGIHVNNGVPNKMFYLLSAGGTFRNVPVRGIGIDKAIQIAYKASKERLWPSTATLVKGREGMIMAAQSLYGANSLEVNQVMKPGQRLMSALCTRSLLAHYRQLVARLLAAEVML